MKRFTSLMLLLLCAVTTTWAQLEVGKVYQFKSGRDASKAMNMTETEVKTATLSETDRTLFFAVEEGTVEGTFALRNICYEKYIKPYKGERKTWPVSAEKTAETDLYISVENEETGAISIRYSEARGDGNNNAAHHEGDYGGIVSWESSAGASQWTPIEKGSIEDFATIDLTALDDAISAANNILTNAGYSFSVDEAVALQIDDPNAAGYLSVSHPACDEDVLAHAIDKNEDGTAKLNTLYHSNWKAGLATPYMQVDLGSETKLDAFILDYTTRQDHYNAAPYAITVSGSNDGENFTPITELSRYDAIYPIPAENAQNYSAVFAADEAYRYLRFTVTSSPNDNNSFGVADFNIKKVTMTAGSSGIRMRYATIYKAILDATAVKETPDVKQYTVYAAVPLLNKIVGAVATEACPFELTTDINNPKCYLIKSSRVNQNWNNPYWRLSGNGVLITQFDSENAAKKEIDSYWFFMEDKNSGLISMYPFAAKENAMGYKAVNDGYDKLTNNPEDGNYAGSRYQLIVNDGDYPYALKPYGYNTYVSNHSGDGRLMGFYDNVNDHGTRFALIKAVVPGYYTIASGGKYVSDDRLADDKTQRILTADNTVKNIFYYDGNALIGYASGYGFEYACCNTKNPNGMNYFELIEKENNEYLIKSSDGTSTNGWASGYWKAHGSDYLERVEENAASLWTLEYVTSLPVTITAAEYATFNAPVEVTIPEDVAVTAHTVTINATTGNATLSEAIKVIPANTPVILNGAAGTYNLDITTTGAAAIEGNALSGTVAAEYATTDDTKDVFVLAKVDTTDDEVDNPEVGLYLADRTSEFALKGHAAYLVLDKANPANNSVGFRFDFATTAVEKVEMRNEKEEIYDLQGRRINEITQPGIYVVNGVKVLVK